MKDRFLRNAAVRGVLSILAGTAGAQIIALLLMPLLSRIYSPTDYGLYSVVLAAAAVVGPVANLRFDFAVLLPEEKGEVRSLTRLSLISSTFIALLYGLILYCASLIGWISSDIGVSGAIWVAAFTFLTALFTLLTQLCLRQNLYGMVARRSLVRATVQSGSQAVLGLASTGQIGLFIGNLLGQLAGIRSMFLSVRTLVFGPKHDKLGPLVRKYWRFPVIFAPAALLNSLGIQAPLLFLTATYGIAIGGQLGMAERIVAIPLGLIGASVGQTVNAEISKRIRNNVPGLTRTYMRFSIFLAAAGVIVAVVGSILGPFVIPWLLGDEWQQAGTMVQILAVTASTRLVAAPLSGVIVLFQKSVANVVLEVTRLALLAAGAVVVVRNSLPITDALWVVYGLYALSFVAVWLYGLRVVQSSGQ